MACVSHLTYGEQHASLKSIARTRGLNIGTMMRSRDLEDTAFTQVICNDFTQITPGTAFKWETIRRTPFRFDFSWSDRAVSFAEAHGLRVRGHNLCWNAYNPSWVLDSVNKFNARHMLEIHIQTVVGRYRDKIASWDVVNEPLSGRSPRPDGLRPGVWLNSLGPEYIDVAFAAARSSDPKALRVLNFNGLEHPGTDSELNCVQALQLLKSLLSRGVPVQAIGLESHLDASRPIGSPSLVSLINGARALGLEVVITELDVDDTRIARPAEQRRNVVADCYRSYLEYMIPLAAPRELTFWSIRDRDNWYDSYAAHDQTYRRSDGMPHLPGLYNEELQPTPAFLAVQHSLGVSRNARVRP